MTVSPCGKNKKWTIPRISKKTISIVFMRDLLIQVFLGRCYDVVCNSSLCLFDSGTRTSTIQLQLRQGEENPANFESSPTILDSAKPIVLSGLPSTCLANAWRRTCSFSQPWSLSHVPQMWTCGQNFSHMIHVFVGSGRCLASRTGFFGNLFAPPLKRFVPPPGL